jgi:Zn-dependent protease
MWRFQILGFSVIVAPWFWLTAAFLGGGISAQTFQDLWDVALVMMVIFVSILVHELGHALMSRKFGDFPHIELHAMGGTTYMRSNHYDRKQSILVTAAGPAAGLTLAFCCWLALYFFDSSLAGTVVGGVLRTAFVINLIWTIFNLFPVLPMDGGQILRDILGPQRLSWTYSISLVSAALLAIWAIMNNWVFAAVFLAFMAYNSWKDHPANRTLQY